MAATVIINRHTGTAGAPSKSDITSINTRANAYDGHSTGDTTYPIAIPDAGSNYSYAVSTRLSVSANTGSNTIDNIKWYTDGAAGFGTGVTCKVAAGNTYDQAEGVEGTSGTELTTGNNTGLAASPSDAFAYTSGSALSLTGSTTGTGDVGQFAVWQIAVGTTAGVGATSSETFTFSYDES